MGFLHTLHFCQNVRGSGTSAMAVEGVYQSDNRNDSLADGFTA